MIENLDKVETALYDHKSRLEKISNDYIIEKKESKEYIHFLEEKVKLLNTSVVNLKKQVEAYEEINQKVNQENLKLKCTVDCLVKSIHNRLK